MSLPGFRSWRLRGEVFAISIFATEMSFQNCHSAEKNVA